MKQVQKAEKPNNVIPINSETGPLAGDFPAKTRAQVMAYWRRLGLADADLIESLTDDCLQRARRLVGRGAEDEWVLRALEEAQRRFDQALVRVLHLPPAKDNHGVAAARAALLLALPDLPKDGLFKPGAGPGDFGAAVHHALPRPTPPESHLTMAEAPLRFWLFKSPHR